MKKKNLTIMLAGAMAAGMSAGSVQAAAAEDASGDLYVFIAASLSNAMEDIQKDFNKKYPDVNILFNADSSGTLQTQIEEGSRCDIFFSAATKQMDALVDEKLAEKNSVVDLLENKVVLIKPKDGETKVTGFENITDAENIALAGEDVPVGQYSVLRWNRGSREECADGQRKIYSVAGVHDQHRWTDLKIRSRPCQFFRKIPLVQPIRKGSLLVTMKLPNRHFYI